MSKQNKKKTSFGWLKRLFWGEGKASAQDDVLNVEEIISPGKQIVKNFFERKLAVFALCVVLGMFLFVFIGPLFMPKYYDAYTEVTQKNVPPTLDMMSVPSELKDDIKMIDSYGTFSVGLSNAGKVYVWGASKIGTTGLDVANIPEEVQNAKIAMVAAGIDHIIAIGEDGKVYGWGNARLGQYGGPAAGEENNPNIAYMPEEVMNCKVDVTNIKKLVCGYQVSAILMNDNTLYLWGNKNAYANIDKFIGNNTLTDIEFTLNYVVGVPSGGKSVYTGTRGLFGQIRPNINGEAVDIMTYLNGRSITNIIANNNNICLMLDDNSVCFAGDFKLDSVPMATLAADEYFVQIEAGTDFYTGLTNKGNVYSWGGHLLGQSDVPKKMEGVSQIYAGSFQNYAVDENGKLVDKWGLKGYIFGTDSYGADIFQRIVNGGKMTMTIGAVAVIISAVIGIIVGCLSGYFGGKVDMVLMRVMEGFSAIPFLPFALILSAVMAQMTLSENMRIFIIMCILGVLSWTGLARLVRGQVLAVRESEYVTAAQAMGIKAWKIAFKHILPNVISVILVNLTLSFATCMLTESTLSYLGFGVNYPRPTWGNMLYGANNATIIKNFWWQWLFTSMFLAATTICINIVGDTLRDVMDPKSSVDK
ncbi:MAG: ABC transporter permease subunit [Lachnospiraceae bacterium]|nr:ABC transporter permease subunit [Lachnospiraceae bacterium]